MQFNSYNFKLVVLRWCLDTSNKKINKINLKITKLRNKITDYQKVSKNAFDSIQYLKKLNNDNI